MATTFVELSSKGRENKTHFKGRRREITRTQYSFTCRILKVDNRWIRGNT